MTILTVDDKASLLEVYMAVFGRKGHAVICAQSGEECLRLLEKGILPDTFITDLEMPGMDGLELLSAIKKYSFRKYLASGNLTPEIAEMAMALGATGTIEKPFKNDDLIRLIEEETPHTQMC